MESIKNVIEVFKGYEGNRKSCKLVVSYNGEKYKLCFQFFSRTEPSKLERAVGIKPKRILLNESVFFFKDLDKIDPKLLPNKVLTKKFLDKMKTSKKVTATGKNQLQTILKSE